MNSAASSSHVVNGLSLTSISLTVAAAIAAILNTGCGSGKMSSTTPPKLSGNTQVAVLLSSTANDQLSEFSLQVPSITLTSQSGKSVTVYQQPQSTGPYPVYLETIHTNVVAEPLAMVSVPQDVYTSATVTYSNPNFMCLSLTSGAVTFNTFAVFFGTSTGTATVNLASPITVTGSAMGLALDMPVSQSETLSSCGVGATFSIMPTFNLTPVTIASQPTNDRNGKLTGIRGRIASIASGNGFSLAIPDGATLPIVSGSGTVFQGISDFSALAAGMFADLDTAIQSDGSLLATRIAVENTSAVNVMIGPLTEVDRPYYVFDVLGRQQQGDDYSVNPTTWSPFTFDGNTVFQVSGQFTNVQSLPFAASFNASNMAVGQNVYTSAAKANYVGGNWTKALAITLMPQTINGTVSGVSTSGGFAVYTVTLAPYDLIPTLNGATSVEVYADSNTQMLGSASVSVGSTLRFNGLIFNDNGTLRMDCAQINDGVAE